MIQIFLTLARYFYDIEYPGNPVLSTTKRVICTNAKALKLGNSIIVQDASSHELQNMTVNDKSNKNPNLKQKKTKTSNTTYTKQHKIQKIKIAKEEKETIV